MFHLILLYLSVKQRAPADNMSPESSVSSIVSEWLQFFSWVSRLPLLMWLQLFETPSSVTWYQFHHGSVTATRTPRASPQTDPPPLAPGGENTSPALHVVPRVIVHFLISHPGSSDTAETTHSGFLIRSGYSLCGSAREIIIVRRWISENADFQPSGAPSLHMFQSVGSCKNVSLVYIKSLNISSALCSLVGVWKLLFEWFSFFFLWPITLPSLSFTFIYINSFVM